MQNKEVDHLKDYSQTGNLPVQVGGIDASSTRKAVQKCDVDTAQVGMTALKHCAALIECHVLPSPASFVLTVKTAGLFTMP